MAIGLSGRSRVIGGTLLLVAVAPVLAVAWTFSGGALGYIHLSWRAPVRRTSAMLYGSEGTIEIEESSVRLSTRCGITELHSLPSFCK